MSGRIPSPQTGTWVDSQSPTAPSSSTYTLPKAGTVTPSLIPESLEHITSQKTQEAYCAPRSEKRSPLPGAHDNVGHKRKKRDRPHERTNPRTCNQFLLSTTQLQTTIVVACRARCNPKECHPLSMQKGAPPLQEPP